MVSDDAIAPHLSRFADMIDRAFRQYGAPDGLPPRFREAVLATPRHRFVHRYRVGDGPLCDFDADPGPALATVYSDEVMRHVDAAGDLLPSSNSQPSYVLWLLHMLGLAPGQIVLEIGSGSGWLAAIMAHLVGPAGKVTGIELIPALAEQSRVDLAAMGVSTVSVITGDGTPGYPAAAPYDRAIITAATWDLPAALFDQLAEGGRVLVPIELRGGDGCDVTVLRREGTVLIAEQAVPGWFVPLLGAGQDRGSHPSSPADLPFWDAISESRVLHYDLPLTIMPGGAAPAASQFRSFLGRTQPGLLTVPPKVKTPWRQGLPMAPFGVVDLAEQSVALWEDGVVTGYGGASAARRMARAFSSWTEAGLPGMRAFRLEVHRAGMAPPSTDDCWIDRRGATVLAWRLKQAAQSWRAFADPP